MSAVPLALLVLPPVSPYSVVASGVLLAVVLAIAAGFAWWRPKAAPGVAAVLLTALVGLLTLDLLAGGWLLRQAWMSYSVMEGARYYGIGNEYAGALFGAMMALSLVALQKHPGRWPRLAAAWLAVCALMGLPQFGANAGALLGGALGCGAAAMVWKRGHLRGRDLLTVVAAVTIVMAAVLVLDLARSGAEQSHIAQAVGSGGNLVNIARRKALLNGYLLFHSPWSLALLAAAYGLWTKWKAGRVRSTDSASLRGAWTGLLVGSVALFALNDSGVVAAAECLLVAYAGFSLFLPIMYSQPRISEDAAS